MAGIFTRKNIAEVLNDENATPEEKTEKLYSLYGRAISDGYIAKSAAQAALDDAVEKAKNEAVKDIKLPDVKDSIEYKDLLSKFDAYKTKQDARYSADYASVKPKFFEQVYDRIDRTEGAKPLAEQLETLKKEYEEYFNASDPKPAAPQFGGKSEGSLPKGDGEGSFAKYWGYENVQKG